MGDSVVPMSKPLRTNSSWAKLVMSHRWEMRSGSSSIMSIALLTAATFAGGMLALKIRERELCLM